MNDGAMIDTIFLDMDGVLVDFVNGALRAHNADIQKFMSEWPSGQWDMASVLGISEEEFFNKLSGAEFWEGLDKYPWADLLLSELSKIADVVIATTPCNDPQCPAGKVLWLNKHYPHLKHYMIGYRKQLLAGPTRVLIDDNDLNCERFRNEGGMAILFPQHWNQNYEIADRKVEYTLTAIKEIVRAA